MCVDESMSIILVGKSSRKESSFINSVQLA